VFIAVWVMQETTQGAGLGTRRARLLLAQRVIGCLAVALAFNAATPFITPDPPWLSDVPVVFAIMMLLIIIDLLHRIRRSHGTADDGALRTDASADSGRIDGLYPRGGNSRGRTAARRAAPRRSPPAGWMPATRRRSSQAKLGPTHQAAPFRRNDQLLECLRIGLAVFPGSGVTDNLADKARKLGIHVRLPPKGVIIEDAFPRARRAD
jgi:hypothetical protein